MPKGRITAYDLGSDQDFDITPLQWGAEQQYVLTGYPPLKYLQLPFTYRVPVGTDHIIYDIEMAVHKPALYRKVLISGTQTTYDDYFMASVDNQRLLMGLPVGGYLTRRIPLGMYELPVLTSYSTRMEGIPSFKLGIFLPVVQRDGELYLVGDSFPVLAVKP